MVNYDRKKVCFKILVK